MRLAAKFTLALMVAIIAVLSVQALLHLRRISAVYEREMRDDLTILGNALGSAAGEIWTASGRDRALAYVRGANRRRARTQIRLYQEPIPAPGAGGARSALPTTQLVGDTLVSRVPVLVRHRAVATLELRRGVGLVRADFDGLVWTQVGTTAALALLSALVVMALGILLVGRPVTELIALARRVGRGEFALLRDMRQNDEIGSLAREMNSMAAALQQAQAVVHEQRHARTALLEQLRHADRLSTVGKLASGIAHQLGTPLNVVAGRAAMIASGEATGGEATESAEIIVEQAGAMTATIRQLLDFSRRSGLRRRHTVLVDVLDEAKSLVEPIADERDVEVHLKADPSLVASLDAGKVLQVVTNMMMNAVQAMPDGGRLRLSAGQEQIDEPLDRRSLPGRYVVIGIQDDGVGIGVEQLEHIFEPFFTTKELGQGTGLGLTVCDGIVREHGGWIDLQTMVGEGTCFAVYLPAEDAPEEGQL